MDTELLEHRLALVERQIVDAERHITLRRDVLNRLELEGLGASDTADDVRDLLPVDSSSTAPTTRQRPGCPGGRRRTKTGREQMPQMTYANACYSITSLAMASMLGGMVRPSAFAVPRLMIKSNLVGVCTGKSAGLSPLRMRPV
jgi:hypothetical protein